MQCKKTNVNLFDREGNSTDRDRDYFTVLGWMGNHVWLKLQKGVICGCRSGDT